MPHQLPIKGAPYLEVKKTIVPELPVKLDHKNVKHKWKSTKKGVLHVPMKGYSHRQAKLSSSLQSFIG